MGTCSYSSSSPGRCPCRRGCRQRESSGRMCANRVAASGRCACHNASTSEPELSSAWAPVDERIQLTRPVLQGAVRAEITAAVLPDPCLQILATDSRTGVLSGPRESKGASRKSLKRHDRSTNGHDPRGALNLMVEGSIPSGLITPNSIAIRFTVRRAREIAWPLHHRGNRRVRLSLGGVPRASCFEPALWVAATARQPPCDDGSVQPVGTPEVRR